MTRLDEKLLPQPAGRDALICGVVDQAVWPAGAHLLIHPVPNGFRWVVCVKNCKSLPAAHEGLVDAARLPHPAELVPLLVPDISKISERRLDGFEFHWLVGAAEQDCLACGGVC